MLIDNKHQIPYINPSFGTSYLKTYKNGILDHEASTNFFVKGFQWNKFFDYFIDLHKSTDKVNVYSLACSDGSEAYSIAMLLISKFGEKSKKFFPIKAVDIDDKIMKVARSGYMDLSLDDELLINKYTNNNLNKFFERTNKTFLSDNMGDTDERKLLTRFKIKPILKDKVIFETANIDDYIDTMPNKNNLIFCRNVWPYFGMQKIEEKIAMKLSQKTDEKSFVITGRFDDLFCPMDIKNCYGFSTSKNFDGVYDKSGSNYFDPLRWFNRINLKDE